MHQIGAGDIRDYPQVHAKGLKGAVALGKIGWNLVVLYLCAMEILRTGSTEATHPQIQLSGQHPAQLGHMDTSATVNLRREFFCHNIYTHPPKVVQSGLLL